MLSRQGFLIGILIVLVGFVLFLQIWGSGKQKTGYVIIEEVFNSFSLKKDLQGKFEKTKSSGQKMIDSLQFELQLMASLLDKSKDPDKNEIIKFEQKKEEYFKRKEKFDSDMQNLSAEYDRQILSQLNQYVQEYGKENGYTYIFGNDNDGSLMYAKDAENVTKQVVEYINSKYQGITR